MSSNDASSVVTYTYVSSEARSWSIATEDPYEEDARHALEQAQHSQNDDIPMEDQPLPADASPVALSPGYVADSDPEENEEDPVDYPVDEGDDDDEEDKDEEEEHLAPANSTAVSYLAIDHVPSAEETEPFETNESPATPLPLPTTYRITARMFTRSKTPILFPSKEEVARLLSLPTPPPSALTPLSLPLPQIPSLPTSPTYAQALLGTPPLLPIPLPAPSTSRRADIFMADMSFQKRLLLIDPTRGFEVGETSATKLIDGQDLLQPIGLIITDHSTIQIRYRTLRGSLRESEKAKPARRSEQPQKGRHRKLATYMKVSYFSI
nr:hypothetical protein [Tanacetum cinerariifolium]